MRWGFIPVWKAFMTMTMAHNEKQNWKKDNNGGHTHTSININEKPPLAYPASSNATFDNPNGNLAEKALEADHDKDSENLKDEDDNKRYHSSSLKENPIAKEQEADLDLDLDLLDTDIELEWDGAEKLSIDEENPPHIIVNCISGVKNECAFSETKDGDVGKTPSPDKNRLRNIVDEQTRNSDEDIKVVDVEVETIESRKVRLEKEYNFCDKGKSDETRKGDNGIFQDKWRMLFDKYDPEGFGEMPWCDFMKALKSQDFSEHIQPGQLQLLTDLALVYSTQSNAITFQHFVNIMSGKRSRSFKCALHQRDREVCSESDFHLLPVGYQPPSGVKRMARLIADEFLTDERDRKYYADHYRCLPPPLFIISVTLIELGFFTYYTIWHGEISSSGPLPMDSPFVYRPDKRHEVWRFIFYMVLHSGWVHLMFNLLVQLLVGLPLEMVHGSLRIGAVYMAGVLAGSLGTSVFDPDVYLVGASGGVYALLAAHLANVLINYNNMEFGLVRLVSVFLIASVDVGFAIYDRYAAIPGLTETSIPAVSYVAHLAGAVAGLTIGLLVLKNFEQKLREQLMWWLALGVYAACTLFAILFNIFHPVYPEVIPSDFVELPRKFPSPN